MAQTRRWRRDARRDLPGSQPTGSEAVRIFSRTSLGEWSPSFPLRSVSTSSALAGFHQLSALRAYGLRHDEWTGDSPRRRNRCQVDPSCCPRWFNNDRPAVSVPFARHRQTPQCGPHDPRTKNWPNSGLQVLGFSDMGKLQQRRPADKLVSRCINVRQGHSSLTL